MQHAVPSTSAAAVSGRGSNFSVVHAVCTMLGSGEDDRQLMNGGKGSGATAVVRGGGAVIWQGKKKTYIRRPKCRRIYIVAKSETTTTTRFDSNDSRHHHPLPPPYPERKETSTSTAAAVNQYNLQRTTTGLSTTTSHASHRCLPPHRVFLVLSARGVVAEVLPVDLVYSVNVIMGHLDGTSRRSNSQKFISGETTKKLRMSTTLTQIRCRLR